MLLEYLLARADLIKDEYFDKKECTEEDRRELKGKLSELGELIGLVAFMDSFKVLETK